MTAPLPDLSTSEQVSFTDAVKATFRHEEWKYTNLAPLLARYQQNPSEHPDLETPKTIALAENRILIVNGEVEQMVAEAQLVTDALPIAPVAGTATASPFTQFVATVAKQTLVVRIAKNVHRTEPITIDIVTNGSETAVVCATKIRIEAASGAQVTVHEKHHSIGDNECMDATLTEVVAEANSIVSYVKHTQLPPTLRHIGSTIGYVHANARLNTHAMCLGGPYVRNDLYVRLEESGAEAYLNGLAILHGSDVADNHTAVDHLVPRCHSEELYKGIYHDASTGIFNGKVFVREQAQKTTAYQSSRSLLLGENAQVNAKPQLEIWADDVKCSHGATTGQLDPEALFYLRSRGLTLQQAKELLVDAFAQEMFDRLP